MIIRSQAPHENVAVSIVVVIAIASGRTDSFWDPKKPNQSCLIKGALHNLRNSRRQTQSPNSAISATLRCNNAPALPGLKNLFFVSGERSRAYIPKTL
jgi:hypothetical protein